MKKLTVSMMAVGLALGVCSCTDHNFERPKTEMELKYEVYDEAFIKEFGYVYPEQDWGFGDDFFEKYFGVNVTPQAVGTRSENANANQWYYTWEVDPNVQEDEKNGVFDYVFNKRYSGTPRNIANFENYFVTQVWKGDADSYNGQAAAETVSYPNSDGDIATVPGGGHMDYLLVKEGTTDDSWYHANNFNNSANPNEVAFEGDNSIVSIGKMMMVNSGTHGFQYKASNPNHYSDRYIVLKGSQIFGNSSPYKDYYYVCFDYENAYTDAEKAKETTFITLNGTYEKLTGRTEGTPAIPGEAHTINIKLIVEDYSAANSAENYTQEYINSLFTEEKVINLLKERKSWGQWGSGLPSDGTYSDLNLTYTLSSLGDQWGAKILVSGTFVYTTPETPATEGSETWETVTFNNGSDYDWNTPGFYKDTDLSKEKILQLMGVTEETRNLNFTYSVKGYNYGNSHYDGDGNYTDWIVRISPAILKDTPEDPEIPEDPDPTPEYHVARIFAEDLGTTGDWDFNDVVFEIRYNDDFTASEVWLLAAGGTLPLTLNVGSESVEVHAAFDVQQSVMVNTNWHDPSCSISGLPSVRVFTCPYLLHPKDVKIKVSYNGEATWSEITARTGKPAAKFCVPTDLVWCNEKQPITERSEYDGFDKWVKAEIAFW